MEKPTLEEIKERYKYAKHVRCVCKNTTYYNINLESIKGDFVFHAKDYRGIMVILYKNGEYAEIVEYKTEEIPVKHEEVINTPKYYDNTNGSLYLIAKQRNWNAYQFDLIKRIDRATKKGEFEKDLNKSKNLIDLWLKENNNKLNSK